MRSLLLTALLTALLAALFACQPGTSSNTGNGGTATTGSPTEAYKQLYAAVKSKDVEKIKAAMTKKTQEFAQMVAARQSTPIEKVFENGFTATTFAESLPEIRDERVNGEYGAVEVWNAKDKRYEDLGFIYEDGSWKLAVGEMFAGSFKSPGASRSFKEQEAANLLSNNMVPVNVGNTNSNSNVKVIVPKERPEPANK
ncbi:MAG TPA: hypothetical protein VMZ26_15640 [Pyrinomonadaceae bacterium]|nr:hypothetical protein [Pyrinomonadaceae bacterium]